MEGTAGILLDEAGEARESKGVTEPPCLVLLGRAGDILNSLPIALHYSRKHHTRVPFITQRQFIPILNAASYVHPIAWDGELYMTINEAVKFARTHYRQVFPLQTAGHQYKVQAQTKSYCDEQFRMAGLLNQRGKVPLILDKRNRVREAALVRKHQTHLPIILYNLKGFSSPFPHTEFLRQELSRYSGVASLIDTHTAGAESLVDLLGLYDIAECLITIDTATMHLAAASKIPMIALTVDNKHSSWHTTPPLGNVVINIPYTKTKEKIEEVTAVLDSILRKKQKPIVASSGRIIHVTDGHWMFVERCQSAVLSWLKLYQSGMHAAHLPSVLKRDARDIGSKRPLPFLKDVLHHAMDYGRDSDFLLWTNSDTILETGFLELLKNHTARCPIVVGRRVDYRSGKPHLGRDVAAFSVRWLKEHWDAIPDLVCGAAEIDVWMALCARAEIGLKEETARKLFKDIDPVDLAPGKVKHIEHPAPWDLSETRYSEPANLYNVRGLRSWCQVHQPKVQFDAKGFVNWEI